MLLTRVIALCSCSLMLHTGCDPLAPADMPPPDEVIAGSAGTAGAAHAGSGGQPTAGTSAPAGTGAAGMIPPQDAASSDHDASTDEDAGAIADHDAAPYPDPNTCADGFPRGVESTITRQLATLDPSPEGVGACANGDVFAGAAEKLWRIPLDGSEPELFATLPGRSLEGIVCDDRGRIFVADISALAAVLNGTQPELPPAVVMLEGDGSGDAVPLVLDDPPPEVQLTGYNGLLWVPGRGIYTTDMFAGLIVRFEETAPGEFVGSVVQDKLPGANGLAYDPKLQTLYVVLTGLLDESGIADSSVESFPLLEDGTLGARTTLWTSPNWLDGADGLAIDELGVLYRANQLSGTVSRMSDEAVVAHVPNPASLAFRGGTLLISDFKILGPLQGPGGVYAVDLGVCGGALQ